MDALLDLLARHLGDYAYLGLFLILSVGAFGLPIPEEIVLIAAGLFVEQGRTELLPTLLVCGAGQVVGDFLLYWVGRRWGTRPLHGLLRRTVRPERLLKVRRRLDRWGLLVVFFGRYLTGVRPAVFLGAGATGIPLGRFVVVDGSSALVSLFVWVLVGRHASPWIEVALRAVADAEEKILAALLAVLAVLVLERVLVRIGRLGERSAPVRVTNFVRVPILVVTATFAVVLARAHDLHQRNRLAARLTTGELRSVDELGSLLEILPAATDGGRMPDLVLAGSRELVEAAVRAIEFAPGSPPSGEEPAVLARPPDLALVRGGGSRTVGLRLWRMPVEYRSRPIWLGQLAPPGPAEVKALAEALTRSRHALRTTVGPRLRPRSPDRRRVLVAILRAPSP